MLDVAQTLREATAHQQAGRLREAEVLYRQVMAQEPGHAGALFQLGLINYQVGNLEASMQCLRGAIATQPACAPFYNLLGIAQAAAGQNDEAITHYLLALKYQPAFPEALNNLGNAYRRAGQIDQAIDAMRKAVAQRPNFSEAFYNLGNTVKDAGQLDEAMECYRHAIAIDPRNMMADSARLYALYFHPALDSAAILAEHRRWNQRHALPLTLASRPPDVDRTPGRRLRVGYVSPDFRSHPVGRMFVPVIACREPAEVEVFCYSDVHRPDSITRQTREYADHWRNTARLSDEQLALLIRQDRIDVLVDLTLHMENHRLLAFARRPAPVQVTWLGYPGTTGLTAMDYRLSDPCLDPPSTDGALSSRDAFYSEKTVRLAETFWCYAAFDQQLEVGPPPALSNGYVTFGCMNNYCKVTWLSLDLWAGALHAVPNARLLVRIPAISAQHVFSAEISRRRIDATRIDFVGQMPHAQYMQTHHRIDVNLDTFPYNGHTTTLDGLWMGIPTISLAGESVVSRGGLSILSNAGLPDFVATAPAEYAQIAERVCSDVARLAELRRTLRDRLQKSVLMNGPRMARSIEAAFRQMWIDAQQRIQTE